MRFFWVIGATALSLGAVWACSGKSRDFGGAHAAESGNGGVGAEAGANDTSAAMGGSAAGGAGKPSTTVAGGAGGRGASGGSASTASGAGGTAGEAGSGGAAGSEAGAPAASLTPNQLPGLALWLDASVGVTANDTHHVAAWADRSLRHNDAAAASVNQPVLTTESIHGLPAIHFDGLTSQATLAIADSGSLRWGTADFSLQVVAAYANTTLATPRYGILYGKFAEAAPYTGLILFASYPTTVLNTAIAAQLDSDTQTLLSQATNLNDGKARLYGVRRVAGKVTMQVNDADGNTFTWAVPDDVSAPGRPAYIGSQPGNQYLIGDIAEIVAVSGTLSADEHAALTAYLMQKYQL